MTHYAQTFWSWSKFELYDMCPFKFYLKNIEKLEEPQSDAMARGNAIHKLGEKIMVTPDLSVPVPFELQGFKSLINQIRVEPAVSSEEKWGFARDWTQTGYFTKGPANKVTWLRVTTDWYAKESDFLMLGDFKTGKYYGTNEDQVELFGLSGMFRFGDVRDVQTRLWYLDDPKLKNTTAAVDKGREILTNFKAADKYKLRDKWEAKLIPMFTDTVFAPRPNDKCFFCAFSKNADGPHRGRCKAG